jgi:hypothetical protein
MFESFVWVSLQCLERQPEHVFNCGLAAESGAGKSYKQKIVLPAKA